LAAYGLAPAVGLITAPFLARALGVEGRGQLAAILQPLTVADSLAAIGLPMAVAFFVARGGDPSRVHAVALRAVLVTSFAAFMGLVVYSSTVSTAQGINQLLLITIWASVIPGALIAVRRSVWSGLQNWKLIDAERTSFAILRLLVIVGLALLGIRIAAWFAIGPILAGLAVSAIVLGRRWPTPTGRVEIRPAQIYGFGLRSALGTVSTAASARLDQAIMPGLATTQQLGLYAVAVTIAEVPLVVGTVLARNLLSEAASGGSPRRFVRTLVAGGSLAALGAGLIALVASWAVPLVFGPQFSESVPVVYVLLGSTVLTVMAAALAAVVSGWHRPLTASLPQVVSICVVIGLFWRAGAGVSAMDAAWISLISQAAALVVSVLVAWVCRPKGVSESSEGDLQGS